ncbi:MAG: 4-oxalocrotonate tautomerase [Cyanobacteria bacterium J06635_15]
MANLLPLLLSTGLALITVTTACTPQQNSQQEAIGQTQQNPQWEAFGQLPISLESHQMVALGDFVYVLGGWNEPNGVHPEVYFTPLTPEQALNNWQETTAPLPIRLQHHAVLVHGDALYVLGGDNGFWEGSEVSDRIFRAVPGAQGDISEWVEVGQLPAPLTIHAVTALDDQVYIMGGSNTFRPGTTVVDTVFTATIAPDGTFGEFQPLAAFPTPIGWMTATTIDRRIFAISGKVEFRPTRLTENVWVAEADSDNQLSSFEPRSTVIARQRHATVLLDRTLVVIAGGGTDGVISTVEAATVDLNGNLEPWTALAPLPEARYAHAAFARDGYIYVSGGFLRYGSNDTSRDIFRLPFRP